MLNIFVNIKSIGKKKPALAARPYVLPDIPATLRDLITSIIKTEVDSHNASSNLLSDSEKPDNMIFPFLTQVQIEDSSTAGKIGFGHVYSDKKAKPQKAVETALQGYEDGLFRLVINDTEVHELDAPINLKDGDTLTFIKLTFLAGRLF